MSKLDEIRARANAPFGTAKAGIGQVDADRDYLLAFVREQKGRIDAALDLHRPAPEEPESCGGVKCDGCWENHPCSTVIALTATEGA